MNPAPHTLDPPWCWPDDESADTHRALSVDPSANACTRALIRAGVDPDELRALATPPSVARAFAETGDPPETAPTAALLAARAASGPIGLCADYDVDGATSAAILAEALDAVSAHPRTVLDTPERNTEGFGPNARVLEGLARAGARTIVTLDCGTAARTVLDAPSVESAVIIDHHPGDAATRPERAWLCNPHERAGGPGAHGALCTGALAFAVARALVRPVRTREQTRAMRRRWTVLAGLATACDMMPVRGAPGAELNRALIRCAADALAGASPGLDALIARAGLDPAEIDTETLGWRIGPMLNAGSRMGESALAARCLASTEHASAAALAAALDRHNRARKAEIAVLERTLDAEGTRARLDRGPVVVTTIAGAAPGQAGLLAGWCARRYGWPAIVLAPSGERWVGSGRSALGFDLGGAVRTAAEQGLIRHGGGHRAACGLSLETAQIDPFRTWLAHRAHHALGTARPERRIGAVLHARDCTRAALERTTTLTRDVAPFGPGLERPLYGVRSALIGTDSLRITRNGHLLGTLLCEGAAVRFAWWRPPSDWPARLGLGTTPAEQIAPGRIAPTRARLALRGHAHVAARIVDDAWREAPTLYIESAQPAQGDPA